LFLPFRILLAFYWPFPFIGEQRCGEERSGAQRRRAEIGEERRGEDPPSSLPKQVSAV
jgi:hypothetical protein